MAFKLREHINVIQKCLVVTKVIKCLFHKKKIFFFGHRGLIRNSTQTAVTNMMTIQTHARKINYLTLT